MHVAPANGLGYRPLMISGRNTFLSGQFTGSLLSHPPCQVTQAPWLCTVGRGVGELVRVSVGVFVGVEVSVGVGVSVGVEVSVGVWLGVGLWSGVWLGVGLGVGLSLGEAVGVGVSVLVGVEVLVGVGVPVGVGAMGKRTWYDTVPRSWLITALGKPHLTSGVVVLSPTTIPPELIVSLITSTPTGTGLVITTDPAATSPRFS